ncbi:FAD-dependent oxidoreductase [uncultured Jannaschia sp.]|uniref:FAD-dependent oxidoreductase n=1 Tax=uncultured Jannaschia sp. TaxID=293347 RepID=UPI0026241D9A|nr:FAD-dependent oxidoreductase [uncultured Jannaschia sp.]
MRRDPDAFADGPYDLLVVGGGIYGACAAADAARRGLRVALIERDDFGGATSHNSLKTIHGGIRYIQHLDIARLMSSARERRHWMDLAPELVVPRQFVIPLYGHAMKGPEAFGAAAMLYNALTARIRRGRVPAARVLSVRRAAELMPGIDTSGMSGGGTWHDGQILDANRLLMAFLHDAAANGAQVANYVAARDLLGPATRVEGVLAEDRATGRSFEIRARLTLNCAGAGAAGLARRARHELSAASFSGLARAMNLVVDRDLTAGAAFGVVSRRKSDAVIDRGGRMFFVAPWMSRTMIGTAHLPFEGDPETYRFDEGDLQEFLAEVNEAAPALGLARADVAYCHAGLTPAAIDDDAKSGVGGSGEVRRHKRGTIIDHRAADGVDGLVSVVSIKYTTARLVAERVVDHAAARLDRPAPAPAPRPLAEATLVDDPADADALAARCREEIRDGMALHLGDVVFRRTRLAETGRMTEPLLDAAARAMAGALDWNEARRDRELAETRATLARHRGPAAAA